MEGKKKKMNRIKKFVTAVMASSMVCGMGIGNIAYAVGNGSITVSSAVKGQEYKIYRMMDYNSLGNPGTQGHAVGNYSPASMTWENFIANNLGEYFTISYGADNNSCSDDLVQWIDRGSDIANQEAAKQMAKKVSEYLENADTSDLVLAGNSVAGDNGTVNFKNLDMGYYVLSSQVGTVLSIETTNPHAEVVEKNTPSTIDKAVEEDSTKEFGDFDDAAVGEVVNFKSNIHLDKNASKGVIYDVMQEGLTLVKEGENKVRVSGLTEGTDYTVDYDVEKDGEICTFVVTFSDSYMKSRNGQEDFELLYSAVLNEKAVVGTGVENKTRLEYKNGTFTEWDKTKTYTYDFKLHKYGDDSRNLKADFMLFKGALSDEEYRKVLELKTFENVKNDANLSQKLVTFDVKDGVYNVNENGNGTSAVITTTESGMANLHGFDADGLFSLVELSVEDGYNIYDGVITVNLNRQNGTTIDGTYSVTSNADDNVEQYTVDILNKKGTLLPSTGGIGTRIFYMVGGSMVLLAVVTLLAKRKVTKE